MLAGMSASTFQEWQEYAAVEPFGQSRLETRLASIECFLHNRYRDPQHRPEPWAITDFAPYIQLPPQRELSPEEAQAKIDRECFGL